MNKIKTLSLIAIASSALCCSLAFAQDKRTDYSFIKQVESNDQYQKVEAADSQFLQNFEKKFPKLKIKSALYLKDLDLYEVITWASPTPSYTNKDITFFILNNQIIDPVRYSVIDDQRQRKQIANMVRDMSKNTEIQAIYGNPNAADNRHILIFADPDCPYCKALDQEFVEYFNKNKNLNLTVTYYMNPLIEIRGHENAKQKAAKILCAEDKNKAWFDWMNKSKLPDNSGDCKNNLEEHIELSNLLGFDITPIILFDNGKIFKGKPSTNDITNILNMEGVRPDVIQ